MPEYSGVNFLAAGFFIISAKDFHPDCRARFSSVAQVNQLVSQINLDNWLLRVYPSLQVRMHWVGFSSGLSFTRYSSIANVAIGPAVYRRKCAYS